MNRWAVVRFLAGAALLAGLWLLGPYLGVWDVALVFLVGAGLGGVLFRPKREKRFRADTYRPIN